MDFNDFPATQVCEKNDDFEPTQNTQSAGNSDNEDRKQVGVLIVGDTEYPIFTGTNTIGRHASNNIVLKDSTISKHHAEIEGRRKNSFICDLKSCNTTVLNKEKLLPNRLFELSDGALLRIGSISAIYRKLSSLNESILKTPAAARCNEIIASTPDSVLNTTDDDSSVVYGTQKNSAGPSEFRRPSLPPQRVDFNRRNLSLEFLSDDSLLNSETGSTSIYEEETQAFPQPKKSDSSGIHDLDTKEYSVNKPGSSYQTSLENSQEMLEADTQAVPLNSKSVNTDAENLFADDDIILEVNTRSISENLKPLNENLNQGCETEDEVIFRSSTQQVSSNSDKIYQEATQAVALKSPVSHSKEFNKYSKTSEEISEDASGSVKSGNIHEEATQACPLESPKSSKLDKFEDKMIIEDSDTDEEGIFEEATQKVPASRKIYEEPTQVVSVENPMKTGILGRASRNEDSDTDEDGIFESSTQKCTASSPKKIHEEDTQAFVVNVKRTILSSKVAKVDSNLNDSDTDEEGIFQNSTQTVSPNKSDFKSDLSLKFFSISNKISAEPESNILNDSKTDEEIFSKPQQKYSSNKEIVNLNICGYKIAKSLKVNLNLNELSTDDEGSFLGFLCQKENSNFKEVEEKIEADKKLRSPVVEIFTKADAKPEDSDTDDEGILKKKLEDKNQPKTLIQKENIVGSETSEPESKNSKSASKNTAEDSETDDEGIFQEKEASTKELEENKSKTSVQENVSVSENSKSVFENSSKVNSKTPEDSETDNEGIFQKKESSTKEFEEKKSEIIQREKMQESKNSNSESKDWSASENSKSKSEILAKANSKNSEDSETKFISKKRVSVVKKYKGKKKLKTPIQKEKLDESNSKSELEISNLELQISGKDSKTVEDSETEDEGIFEHESANELHENKSTTLQKEQMSQSKNSKTELKISSKDSETVDDSETGDEGIFQKEESMVKKYKENKQLKTPAQKEHVNDSKSGPENARSEFKISTKDVKTAEHSETDNEAVFRTKESNANELKEKKLTPIQKEKSRIQKEKTPSKPSTSKEPNQNVNPPQSEIDDDGPTQIISFHSSERESFDLRNRSIGDVDEMAPTQLLEDFKASKMKTPENKTSSGRKTSGNESNFEREIVGSRNGSIEDIDEMAPTQLLQDFEAPKMKVSKNEANSGSKTSDNDSNSEREIFGSRNASIENIDEMAPTQLLQDFETSMMKTHENKTGFGSKTSVNDSNSEKENFDSRNASIEDLDYEMAPTQLLEDFETSKMKTPENKTSFGSKTSSSKTSGSKTSGSKSNSKSKTNSGRRSSRRSNPKMHDTIEENLNEMFEGEIEEIGEPSQMLTQQLENILEESQVNEELLQTPSTSRRRAAQQIQTSPVKASTSLSERSSRSKNSPQVDADNCSPRMSKLNIIRSKKELKVANPTQKKFQNDKGSKDKTRDTHPLKKRPLKMSEEESDTSTGGREKRLKVGETEELEITTLFARRSVRFDGSSKNNKKTEFEEKEEVKESKKNLKGKTKVKVKDLNSFASSTLNDSLEEPKRRGRRPKMHKTNDEAKVDSMMNGRASKRIASSSSNSFADDSGSVSTSAAENLKVPSKPKKTKKANLSANEVENEENEVKTLKTRRVNKRQLIQSKEIISNSSSSSSLVESSLNGTVNSKKEKLKKTEQKKTSTRGRKEEDSDVESMPADKWSASSSMISLTSGDGNSSDLSTPTRAKRSRVTSPLKHKVLFTGVSADNYRNCLKTLGLTETEDINKFTVLVTDKVRRTLKFLRAASQGIPIVSVNWLADSTKKNNVQELENYIVKDPTAEAKFGFNLSDSLKKAREKKMLEGFTVVLTPNISAPPTSELKEMVLASGGKVVMRPPAKWSVNTVVLSDEKDLQNAKKFMAKAPKTVTLHSTEFLLTGILKQEVDLHSYVLKIK